MVEVGIDNRHWVYQDMQRCSCTSNRRSTTYRVSNIHRTTEASSRSERIRTIRFHHNRTTRIRYRLWRYTQGSAARIVVVTQHTATHTASTIRTAQHMCIIIRCYCYRRCIHRINRKVCHCSRTFSRITIVTYIVG